MKNRVLGIIPARWGSTRFPGKALANLAGKTLLQWTVEAAQNCPYLDGLVVATDDERIAEHIRSFGGSVQMTSSDCPTGTDRLAEVIKSGGYDDFEFIINIQGDEPLISEETLGKVITALKESDVPMATAATVIDNREDIINPNVVKVVMSEKGEALYFSRSPIPGSKEGLADNIPYYRHLGLYAFRKEFLLQYASLPITPLQRAEDLEQLKVLENGYRMQVAIVEDKGVGVDTPEDLTKVERILCQRNTCSSLAASSRH